MKNPIIPEAEVTAVKKVIEAVEGLKEIHSCHKPLFDNGEDDLDRIHILVYMHFVKNLIESGLILKELIEVSREDFEKTATNNGEREVFEVLRNISLMELLDTLKQNLSTVGAHHYMWCVLQSV